MNKKLVFMAVQNSILDMHETMERLSRSARTSALDSQLDLASSIMKTIDAAAEYGDLVDQDEDVIRSQISQRLEGFGFLQPFLNDESIEEIWVNRAGKLHYAKSGNHFGIDLEFSAEELAATVERLIRQSGRRLDRTTPFIDAQLGSGYRLHAVIPDITKEHLCLNIRKFTNQIVTVEYLVSSGAMSQHQADYLTSKVKAGANVLISGATQAGKTTLLSALISALDKSERVVSVEDTFELRCALPDWVAMQTRPANLEGKGEIDLRRLVKETLRMRPTRLVVGEVRGAEALDMLIALNSGIPGLSTIHANSALEALQKLTTLPLLASGNISPDFVRAIINSSMNLFVHCSREPNGIRRIQTIAELSTDGELRMEEVGC